MNDQIIAQIPKNANEEIRVALTEFNGYRLCALRVYFDAGGGEMRPGKSGINVRVAQLPEIIHALQQALEASGGGD